MMSYTPPASESDFELKHRILGALILIVFGVVVLPMILQGPRSEPESDDAHVGDADTKVFISKITPIDGEGSIAQEAAKGSTDGSEPGRAAATSTTPPLAQAVKRKRPEAPSTPASGGAQAGFAARDRDSEAKKPQTTARQEGQHAALPDLASTNAVERGWVVRIGTFSQPENAARIAKILQIHGFRPSVEKTKTSRGSATRVWVGPFAQRVEAARERSKIQRLTGEKGLIAAYP